MSWEEQLRKRRMLLSGQFKDDPALHDVFKKPPKAEALKERLFAQRKVALAKMVPAIADDDVFQPPPPRIKGKDALVVDSPKYVGGKYYVNPFGDIYAPVTAREGRTNADIDDADECSSPDGTSTDRDGKLDVDIELASAADDLSVVASEQTFSDGQSQFLLQPEQQARASDDGSVATAATSAVEDADQDTRYFGSSARPQFFSLYKQLSQQIGSSSIRKPGKRMSLDDTDSSDEEDANVDSARHQFLRKVIHHGNLLPLPLVIRRENTSVLDISHRSLGDQYVCVLSDVIPQLPNLRTLKLRNNNLTDVAIKRLLAVILEHQVQLESIDLSENKLDEESVEQLTKLITQRNCPFQELILEGADLDDSEITPICSALEANKTVHTIKLRSNQLGGTSEFMSIPNVIIAGVAISNMLDVNDTLMTLDLSWNKLGPRSVTIIGSALEVNNSLTDLNLAYNKVVNEGSESIGWALRTNTRLTSLDLSNNEITAHGALVLADCLTLNRSLRLLRLCGNPIGMTGGRALVATINVCSNERTLDLKRCSFEVDRTSKALDPVYPVGKYNLDLTKPIELAIANTIIRAATMRAGCSLINVHVTSEVGSQVTKRSVKLTIPERANSIFGLPYGTWQEAGPRPPSEICKLDADEWEKLLSVCALEEVETGEKFVLPARGRLQCELVYTPKMRRPIEALNNSGLQRLIQMLQSNPREWSTYLTLASDFVFETWHIEQLIDSLTETERRRTLELMSLMMPAVYDTSNVERLLKQHLPNSSLEKLTQMIGQLYYILVNAPTGHYALRMDRHNDRRTALRLAELSNYENAYIAASTFWLESNPSHPFTGQKYIRSNFRNEQFKGYPMKSGLAPSFFAAGLTDQTNGMLEFDYVSTTRPSQAVSPTPNRAVRNRMITQGVFMQNIEDSNTLMQTPRIGHEQPTKVVQRPQSAHANATSASKEKARPRPWTAPFSREASAHAEGLQQSRPFRSLSKGHLGVLKAVAKFKRTLGHWIRATDIPDVPALRRILQRRKVRLWRFLHELELQNLVDDLQKQYIMVFAEQALSVFTKVIRLRIRPSMDSVMVLAANAPNHTSPSGQPKQSKRQHQRHVELRQLTDGVFLGEDFLFVRVKSSCWKPLDILLSLTRIVQQLFSDRELAPEAINIKQRDSQNVQQNVVCPQFHGVTYQTMLEEVDVVVSVSHVWAFDAMVATCHIKKILREGLNETTSDVTSIAIFPSKVGSGGNESITHLSWSWTKQLPTKEVEAFKFFPKIAGLRMALGNLWLTTQQAKRIAEYFPLTELDTFPRETTIVSLFSRIIDLENFHQLLDLVPTERRSTVVSKLGWFNVTNPLQIDQYFDLDLSVPEEQRMAEVLTILAVAEPGNNFMNPFFSRRPELPFIPGWELPANWVENYVGNLPKGVPTEGHLLVTYTSKAEHGCNPILSLRRSLLEQKFLLAVRRPKPSQMISMKELLALVRPKQPR